MFIDRRVVAQFEWGLFWITCLILTVGLIALYSGGYSADTEIKIWEWLPINLHSERFVKQLINFIIGMVFLVVGVAIPTQFFYRYAYLIFGICLAILIYGDISGHHSHGAQRWLSIAGVRFQPSEFMKFSGILVFSRYLSNLDMPINGLGFKQLVIPILMFVIPALIILDQPDLGTACVVSGIAVTLMLFKGINKKTFIIMTSICLLAIIPTWHFVLNNFQKKRVLNFIYPDSDPSGSGYNSLQAQIAVGSGEFFGKGFLKGTQTQLDYVPEHTSDFIFTVIGEEWGFFGCFLVVILYYLLLSKILSIAGKTKDQFSNMVCIGVGTYLFLHVFANIGMVIGIVPVVGIPLPLLSYGGTSAIVTLGLIGIVLGINMRRLIFAR